MTLRHRGAGVALDAGSLAHAFPDATGRLAVFVHGLGETEDAWRLRAARHRPYGDRLRAELGYTPLFVRYNSGLHISHNGRALDSLLGQLTENWPVEVGEIALFGHSMGGLVSRGACHYALEGGWREKVRHVFTLGTPHKGAPLELAANAACHGLSRLPETRPFATPIKVRAAGVKDLGFGYVVDADWKGHDPDALRSNTGTVVPFLERPTTTSSRRASRATRSTRSAGWSATCSSAGPAPGRTRAPGSACSSRSIATATSAQRPISICSTTPPCTRRSGAG